MKKKIISSLLILVMTISVITIPAMAANTSFTDVPAENVYAESIEAMYELGVVGGIGNNQFAPYRAVNYTELRIMLAKLYKNGDTSTVQFPSNTKTLLSILR